MAETVRVMVVEDTAHVRKMLVSMLELDGFDVVAEATDGAEAIAVVESADPDVVVVDYKMPDMDGLETARRIRDLRPDQPLILHTAYIDDVIQQEAEAAGISLCLGKIEGLNALEREIRRLCAALF
ncbi:MAG: response regulator [Actinobacteria bacterium]|nr:MAG: response regulator [Actinomycetota bacterium]